MPQNMVSDQGLHCLLKLQEVRENQSTSAVSALISGDTEIFIWVSQFSRVMTYYGVLFLYLMYKVRTKLYLIISNPLQSRTCDSKYPYIV